MFRSKKNPAPLGCPNLASGGGGSKAWGSSRRYGIQVEQRTDCNRMLTRDRIRGYQPSGSGDQPTGDHISLSLTETEANDSDTGGAGTEITDAESAQWTFENAFARLAPSSDPTPDKTSEPEPVERPLSQLPAWKPLTPDEVLSRKQPPSEPESDRYGLSGWGPVARRIDSGHETMTDQMKWDQDARLEMVRLGRRLNLETTTADQQRPIPPAFWMHSWSQSFGQPRTIDKARYEEDNDSGELEDSETPQFPEKSRRPITQTIYNDFGARTVTAMVQGKDWNLPKHRFLAERLHQALGAALDHHFQRSNEGAIPEAMSVEVATELTADFDKNFRYSIMRLKDQDEQHVMRLAKRDKVFKYYQWNRLNRSLSNEVTRRQVISASRLAKRTPAPGKIARPLTGAEKVERRRSKMSPEEKHVVRERDSERKRKAKAEMTAVQLTDQKQRKARLQRELRLRKKQANSGQNQEPLARDIRDHHQSPKPAVSCLSDHQS